MSSQPAPLERTRTSSFSGNSSTLSISSTDVGESSSAASLRRSFATEDNPLESQSKPHRSHRSSHGGGFLLSSKPTGLSETNHFTNPRSRKGKEAGLTKRHREQSTNNAVGGSPLATTVTSAHEDNSPTGVDGTQDTHKQTKLDVDSAQIVNLALNLSESRKNASRRNISSPFPPVGLGYGENTTGSSLKYYLHQQRRTSRNLSPKADKTGRAITASPRGTSSSRAIPLGASVDSFPESGYVYHFSASTLARAEKAKTELELMAQYRRLLEVIPPLLPQLPDTPSTSITTSSSPIFQKNLAERESRPNSESQIAPKLIGREYNPLQYIRNRRLRLRERASINSEAQGFNDVHRVSGWIDQIAENLWSEGLSEMGHLPLPTFPGTSETTTSPDTSPKAAMDKAKPARRRSDWIIQPSDLLADIHWLEHDDNKSRIENRHGQKVFPPHIKLQRPMTPGNEVPKLDAHLVSVSAVAKRPSGIDLRIDTKLPDFKSVKMSPEGIYDKADKVVTKARDKIRDATHIHHGQNGSSRVHRPILRSRSRSGSDDSESDSDARPRRNLGDGSHDPARDLLEKQMSNLAAQDQADQLANTSGSERLKQVEPNGYNDPARASVGVDELNRNRSYPKRRQHDRASLDIPGLRPRVSLEDLDTTAPTPPAEKHERNGFTLIKNSPSQGRGCSPSRKPFTRTKTRMLHSREPSRDRPTKFVEDGSPASIDWANPKELIPDADQADIRTRSNSPTRNFITHSTTGASHTSTSSGKASLRRGKPSEPVVGIRGLFKFSRGPITRVSDFLWRKDTSPILGPQSGYTTDESEVGDTGAGRKDDDRFGSRPASSLKASPELPSYLEDMPAFGSPCDTRGEIRLIPHSDDTTRPANDKAPSRDTRGRLHKAQRTISIHDASHNSSTDVHTSDQRPRISHCSEMKSIRVKRTNAMKSVDARLHSSLGASGASGKGTNTLPVTGLTHLQATRDTDANSDRQWIIASRSNSTEHGPMTKREIARIRALLINTGVKAQEIFRRSSELQDSRSPHVQVYSGIADLVPGRMPLVPRSQQPLQAARILCDDINRSIDVWRNEADLFYNSTIQSLVDRIDALQKHVADNLMPMTAKATDEADRVSMDLVANHTLQVQRLTNTINVMLRKRRRRLRWLRRGGWVLVEWALLSFMWWVWLIVMLGNSVLRAGRAGVRIIKWLLWL